MLSDLLNLTVAQAIAWVLSVGIAAFVAYGVQWLPVNDTIKAIVNAVVTAMLIAGVTAIASFIPDQWLAMKLIDAAFALLTMLVAAFGAVKFATVKAQVARLDVERLALTV